MIRFSDHLYKAYAWLFRPYNDVDVFVEDEASTAVYQILIERMLDGVAKVMRVIPLGGKRQVVSACSEDQEVGGRPRLYIVDGDFEVTLDRKPPDLRHFYRLGVYCSENLLFDEAAVVEVAFEAFANKTRHDCATEVDFGTFRDELAHKLGPLFIWYAVTFALRPDLPTSGVNVTSLCDKQGRTHILSEAKLASRLAEVEALLKGVVDEAQVDAEYKNIEARFPTAADEQLKLVSGKSYLLPLLVHRLNALCGYRGRIEELKARLARYSSLDIDPDFRVAIVNAARAP